MIKLEVNYENMELETSGSDELIINELAMATIRLLHALEKSEGNSLEDNLTMLILNLIAQRDDAQNAID